VVCLDNDKNKPRDDHWPPRETPLMLINEIMRIMQCHIKAVNTEKNLAQRSYRSLLIELAHRDGVTQLDLVNRTHLKAPTVSVTLQKMEKEGLVERRPDSFDLRATRVYITEKGRELDRKMLSLIKEEEALAMTGISAEEEQQLLGYLRRMRANIIKGDEQFEQFRDEE
jgi:DNA-binding MarR family transcriptional regulator